MMRTTASQPAEHQPIPNPIISRPASIESRSQLSGVAAVYRARSVSGPSGIAISKNLVPLRRETSNSAYEHKDQQNYDY
jgi:hypothetical protein